jgi:predicted lipoprotein
MQPITTSSSYLAPKKLRPIGLAGVVILAVILIVIDPPFTIRPLNKAASTQVSGQAAAPTVSKTTALVDAVWTDKAMPLILDKSFDLQTVLLAINTNPDAAGNQYGKHTTSNPYSYLVKGSGTVSKVDTKSRAGTVTVDLADGKTQVLLQIGPVIRGTALRDATGVISNDQVTNQLEYADVASDMNRRALASVMATLDPASLAGKTITFYGAFTFDPHIQGLVSIVPVKIEVGKQP